MSARLPVPHWTLRRVGTVMRPQPGNPAEVEGVLNPASAHDAQGNTFLFPRLVGAGNLSRVGIAKVIRDPPGRPVDVQRLGVALEPDEVDERNAVTAGVEDPRITRLEPLGLHVMTYTAYGPLGPRINMAVSEDLQHWRRIGAVTFGYDPRLRTNFNLVHNKDGVLFPEPVPGPDGRMSYALLHRPDWEYPGRGDGELMTAHGLEPRPGIWISYVPVDVVAKDPSALTHFSQHRLVAIPEQDWEGLKIGAGPPPVRVDEGWLLVYHGVKGALVPGVDQQPKVFYQAGAMILDANDPSHVIERSRKPLLSPTRPEELKGTVPGVVFPTAIEKRPDGDFDVFYGAADSVISAAVLRRAWSMPRPATELGAGHTV
jgi:predicted GH43/DUF377 family glycosyl hydrolase